MLVASIMLHASESAPPPVEGAPKAREDETACDPCSKDNRYHFHASKHEREVNGAHRPFAASIPRKLVMVADEVTPPVMLPSTCWMMPPEQFGTRRWSAVAAGAWGANTRGPATAVSAIAQDVSHLVTSRLVP